MTNDNQSHTDVDQEDRTDEVTDESANSVEVEGDVEASSSKELSRREKAALKKQKAEEEAKTYFENLGIDPSVLQEQTQKRKAERAYEAVSSDETFEGDKDSFINKYSELVQSGMSEENASKFAGEFAQLSGAVNMKQARANAALPPKSVKQFETRNEFNKTELAEISEKDPRLFAQILERVENGEASVR